MRAEDLRKTVRAGALGLAFAAAAVVVPALAGDVRVNGSTTVDGILMEPFKAEIERSSATSLSITPSNSGRGLTDLVDGKAEIAMISAPLSDVAARVNQGSPGKVAAGALLSHELGTAKVLFIVNQKNPVKELPAEKLAAVLSGQVTNWKEVGGKDERIVVVAEQPTGAMRTELESGLLKGKGVAEDAMVVDAAPKAAALVRTTPGAISFVSSAGMARMHDPVDVLTSGVDVTQTLILVTKGAPTGDVAKVIDSAKKLAESVLGS